jgi:hypothetical protein
MALVAPDLRPRSAVELYDAAIHLCLRGATALPGLAIVGAVMPAIAGLWLVSRALDGKPVAVAAALFTLALMLRSIFAGAASLAGEAALEGNPLGAWPALRKALGRGPQLMSAGGILLLIEWILIPGTLLLGLALWAPLFAAHLLIARGEAGPFSMGGACRERLVRSSTCLVRVLHALATLVVLFDVHTGIAVALYLARTLFALDVSFLDRFASLDNTVYVAFVVALSFVILEPVKTALGLMLLVDARVRSEGLDLLAATERLAARNLKTAALVLLAVGAVVLSPAPARAEGEMAESDSVERLREIASGLGIDGEPQVERGLEAAQRLEGSDAAALRRFVETLERDYGADDADEKAVKARLLQAFDEARGVEPEATRSVKARELAIAILSRPEFDLPEGRASLGEERESLLSRFLRWLFGRKPPKEPEEFSGCGFEGSPSASSGLGGGAFEVITPILVGLGIVLVVWLIVALLRKQFGKKPELAGAMAGAGGAAAPGADGLSALSKPPEGWASEADRLASAGDFRLAVRALYLAVLSALHRRGAIDYDPTRSNWDYVRSFRGAVSERPVLRELTLRFDYAWYGRTGIDSQSYERARELSLPILRPREEGTDA